MGKIKSFGLKKGTRIDRYEVVRRIDCGWEAEIYEVREVPSEAVRAIRLVRNERLRVRDFIHRAWYFEQLAGTGAVPRYHHMGQWFFGDDEGVFFYVFEKLPGENLKNWLNRTGKTASTRERLSTAIAVADALSKIHEKQYAVGDFGSGENVMLVGAAAVKFCDCDPGMADRPNDDFRGDRDEFVELADRLLNRRKDFQARKLVHNAVAAAKKMPPRRAMRSVVARLHQAIGPKPE